jgi:outer membrane lipoprotein-sorting protein
MRIFGLMILGAAGLLAADSQEPSQAQIDEIVQKFAAKEAEFAKARENYTYHQTARIQELDAAGNVSGRWETVSDIVFDGANKRNEKVTRAPVSTLKSILLTPEDLEDLKSVQPFVLTTTELPKYQIRYLGKETLDEIPCYAFAVKPKKVDPGQRYFEGIVWVDDRDLQIVKSYGRGTGVFKKGNAYPKFETYREQIDGKYWFPTYTIANATLHFPEFDQRIKQTVRYEDYKQFKASTTITFGDEVEQPKQEKKPDSPAKKP